MFNKKVIELLEAQVASLEKALLASQKREEGLLERLLMREGIEPLSSPIRVEPLPGQVEYKEIEFQQMAMAEEFTRWAEEIAYLRKAAEEDPEGFQDVYESESRRFAEEKAKFH